MKSHQRPIFLVGLFLVIFSSIAINQLAVADPMTGGNPPYEDCVPPCATSCYDPPPRCPWYFHADALGLRRDPAGNTPFATLGTNFDTVFSSSNLDREFRASARLLIGHNFGDTPYSVEGSYFKIDNWDTSAVVLDSTANTLGTFGNLFSPFSNFGNPTALAGFDYNNLVSIQEKSWLQNGELNVKYLLPMPANGFRATFLTGVRYMSVEEQFLYHSESTAAGGSAVNLSTRSTNDLIGPQIGGYFEFFSIPNSWITFEMKGAICGNSARQQTVGNSLSGVTAFDYSAGDDRIVTAFVGDLELMFNLRVTSHCIARFGYQAMWVDGLALATRNFGPSSGILQPGSAALDTAGNVVYHGPHLGVEVTW